MRALLLTPFNNKKLLPFISYQPNPLIKVLDKPLIEHILEFLSAHKITHCNLLLPPGCQFIQNHLGQAVRWGIELSYRFTDYPLKNLGAELDNEWVLIGSTDSLPCFNLIEIQDLKKSVCVYDPDGTWSGWAIVSKQDLANVDEITTLPNLIPNHTKYTAPIPQSLRDPKSLKHLNINALKYTPPSYFFPVTSEMIKPKVWVSRGCRIHPTVELIPPVFIGEFCKIDKGVTIGPMSVIENHCIIDKNTHISNTLILEKTYVGPELNCTHCVIGESEIINLNHQSHIHMKDCLLLSSSS